MAEVEPGNTLTLETTQGPVVIQMRPDLAPNHVAHIKKLVAEKFYDGIVFHRVIDGFMAQTGCPHGTGTGGSKYPNLKAEFNAEPHVRGTCSMARAQNPEFGQFAILHLLRRRALSRPAIYGLGQSDLGHGKCRQDQARRAGEGPGQDHFGDGELNGRRQTSAASVDHWRQNQRQTRRNPGIMRVDLFDFDLPPERIALRPVVPRDAARMLVVNPQAPHSSSKIGPSAICRDLLRPGDLLVVNDTRVIPARLEGIRKRGELRAKVEILLHQRESETRLARLRAAGQEIEGRRHDRLCARRVQRRSKPKSTANRAKARFFSLSRNRAPRSIKRSRLWGKCRCRPISPASAPADVSDRQDYQTLFARHSGAVAAPTASLHFTPELVEAIRAQGAALAPVTLHVGAGTFLPVKAKDTDAHRMHAEWGMVSAATAEAVNAARAAGGRIVAIGTTALRLIETRRKGRWNHDAFCRRDGYFHHARL